MSAALAVVIPTWNEAERLPALLADLAQAPPGLISERVVADGGSRDGTALLARLSGAQVLASAPGRGRQLQRGIAATTAPWLLLLHADARLCRTWPDVVQQAMQEPAAAWAFDLAIDAGGLSLRLVELAVRLRSQLRQRPYGDQGLLLPRALLLQAGGMPALDLMEDLALIERLQPLTSIRRLAQPLRVDGRRWRQLGVARTTWRNARLRRAWRCGASASSLARLYYGQAVSNR